MDYEDYCLQTYKICFSCWWAPDFFIIHISGEQQQVHKVIFLHEIPYVKITNTTSLFSSRTEWKIRKKKLFLKYPTLSVASAVIMNTDNI